MRVGSTPSKKNASGEWENGETMWFNVTAFEELNPFDGYQLVTSMPGLTSQPKIKGVRGGGRKTKGRLIYKAWAQDSGKVYQAVLGAINSTAIKFNKSTEIKKAA